VDSSRKKGKLPRLERHHYQGHAVVFWTNTLEERARGWLTPAFHAAFRELMLHAAAREHLFCPAYCLMPDHLHFVWMGMRRETDQLNAMKFLRTRLEPALGNGREWQHQPHDHVLREEERRRNAFARFCFYTLANPVRAELVKRENDWPYSGAVVPGYPDLDLFAGDYWERIWKLYVTGRESEPPPPSVPPLRDPPLST
jgi:REP element-mobilizing transposase RayT